MSGCPVARPRAVIAWERHMREVEHVAASTTHRRVAALSSLHKQPVRPEHAAKNLVTEVGGCLQQTPGRTLIPEHG
jgi:hypothetical protein